MHWTQYTPLNNCYAEKIINILFLLIFVQKHNLPFPQCTSSEQKQARLFSWTFTFSMNTSNFPPNAITTFLSNKGVTVHIESIQLDPHAITSCEPQKHPHPDWNLIFWKAENWFCRIHKQPCTLWNWWYTEPLTKHCTTCTTRPPLPHPQTNFLVYFYIFTPPNLPHQQDTSWRNFLFEISVLEQRQNT